MRKLLAALLALSILLSLAACSGKESPEEPEENPITESSPIDSQEPDTSRSEAEKTETEQPVADNQRVVALSVAIVEILDALDVPMVGVPTSSYTLPDSVKDATEIGNPMSPDMEVIKSLSPTIVFSVIALETMLKGEFDSVNIPSSFVNLNSFDGLIDSICLIGNATGRAEQAGALIEDLQSRVATVSEAIEGKEQPTVMLIFGASGNFQIGTERSYVGDLIKRAGGVNIITDVDAGFIPVDMEYLADKNPDYILLMTHANPEESKAAFDKEFGENAVWKNFTAVQNGNVIALENIYFGMSANLLAADAIAKLVTIFYGAA